MRLTEPSKVVKSVPTLDLCALLGLRLQVSILSLRPTIISYRRANHPEFEDEHKLASPIIPALPTDDVSGSNVSFV